MRRDVMQRLTDRDAEHAYQTDASFHAITDLLSTVLDGVETALRDEHVDPEVTRRVINKLLYGIASPGEMRQVQEKVLLSQAWASDLERVAYPVRTAFTSSSSKDERDR